MTTRRPKRTQAFSCFHLHVSSEDFPAAAERQEAADRIGAECMEAGAAGIEEREDGAGIALLIYAPDTRLDAVIEAGEAAGGMLLEPPQATADIDWSQQWKAGFAAIEVSSRLVVRPSFVSFERLPGQREIVIDPGQAFGTGGHASTSLILDGLDACHAELDDSVRVLDVGTGTGVLALSALALGAGQAIGFDLDPLATHEARGFARANDLEARLGVYTGGIEALAGPPFDWVLANLLRRELLPIVPELARCTRSGGQLLVSGLLLAECDEVEQALERVGFEKRGQRSVDDETGDHWASLHMVRA